MINEPTDDNVQPSSTFSTQNHVSNSGSDSSGNHIQSKVSKLYENDELTFNNSLNDVCDFSLNCDNIQTSNESISKSQSANIINNCCSKNTIKCFNTSDFIHNDMTFIKKNTQNQNLVEKDYLLTIDCLKRRITELESSIKSISNKREQSEAIFKRSIGFLKNLLIEKTEFERRSIESRVIRNNISLGTFHIERYGSSYSESWKPGYKFTQLKMKLKNISNEREELEKQRKIIAKRMRSVNSNIQAVVNQSSMNSIDGNSSNSLPDTFYADNTKLLDLCEAEEIIKLKLIALKKIDTDLMIENDKMERERLLHAREIRCYTSQENSRFKSYPVFHDRYLCLQLIGKGGFSEVHKAFDLREQRYVACKIHQLSPGWKETRKEVYIKHAVREYEIQKKLHHPFIVRLHDVFEIDSNTFCTVLEYCDGPDLDFYLKQNKLIPERESRIIISKVVKALKYLNELPSPIIHYDLKPANIILVSTNRSDISSSSHFVNERPTGITFQKDDKYVPLVSSEISHSINSTLCNSILLSDSSTIQFQHVFPFEIKITDFGLSKIVANDENATSCSSGIDLTSQGAGTYWYLPPEIFVMSSNGKPPKVNSKVDVWSVGVILYQILFGIKPFADNLSQGAIIQQNAILKQASQELQFPSKPSVSQEAKNFIKRCLIYDVKMRPDVLTLANEEYLKAPAYKSKVINDAISNCVTLSSAFLPNDN